MTRLLRSNSLEASLQTCTLFRPGFLAPPPHLFQAPPIHTLVSAADGKVPLNDIGCQGFTKSGIISPGICHLSDFEGSERPDSTGSFQEINSTNELLNCVLYYVIGWWRLFDVFLILLVSRARRFLPRPGAQLNSSDSQFCRPGPVQQPKLPMAHIIVWDNFNGLMIQTNPYQ